MSKKILLLCPHPENVAPGQRLKYEQYFHYLRENGFEITVSPFMTMGFWKIVYKKGYCIQKVLWTLFGYLRRTYDLLRVNEYDGIYVFLWVTPFGPPFFEKLFCIRNRKIIYDIDDMVFLGHKSRANSAISFLKGKQKMIYLMKKATHVITCTPKLDEFARQFNSNTTDISSTINTDIYQPANQYTNGKSLIIGWSGSHSTSKYLHLLDNILLELNKRYDFSLLVIGDPDFKIDGIDVKAISWNETTEVQDLQKIDIGLYPLPDEPWVYGKSGLKALQYMAIGIPVIAQAIGANFRIIEDGVTGFLVSSEQEWIEKLSMLINNSELRKEIGLNAKKKVERYYSVNANKDKYLKIFEEVFN